MQEALDCAHEGVSRMEFPFGACIAVNERVLAVSCNLCFSTGDPTNHAEMNAIRKAVQLAGRSSLEQATIYTTTEPCVMCMGAISWARIPRVVYGLTISDSINLGFDEVRLPAREVAERSSYPITVKGGVLAKECAELNASWLKHERFYRLFKNHSKEQF